MIVCQPETEHMKWMLLQSSKERNATFYWIIKDELEALLSRN